MLFFIGCDMGDFLATTGDIPIPIGGADAQIASRDDVIGAHEHHYRLPLVSIGQLPGALTNQIRTRGA